MARAAGNLQGELAVPVKDHDSENRAAVIHQTGPLVCAVPQTIGSAHAQDTCQASSESRTLPWTSVSR